MILAYRLLKNNNWQTVKIRYPTFKITFLITNYILSKLNNLSVKTPLRIYKNAENKKNKVSPHEGSLTVMINTHFQSILLRLVRTAYTSPSKQCLNYRPQP